MAPETINALGRRVGLCQRQRKITPWHLAWSLLAGFATQRIQYLADAQRLCHALFGMALAGSRLMADRGYFKRAYLAALDDAGASFSMQASAAIRSTRG